MKNVENNFDYCLGAAISAGNRIHYYGFDETDLINNIKYSMDSVKDLIEIVKRVVDSDDELNNSVLSFYYSYYCKFGKKIAFNSYARKNSTVYGYKSEESASARARKIKKDIMESGNDLSLYFEDIFKEMGETHRGTMPCLDAEVLVQSVFSYYKSPFYIRESYTGSMLDKFIKDFDKIFLADDKLKRHINSYIFERIYHIHFIGTLVCIYRELNEFIEKVVIKEFDLVYEGDKCEYIDALGMLREIKKYIFTHTCGITMLQKDYKIKLREFILNLCEFALIPDVYRREKLLKEFVRENACNMMDKQLYIDTLRKTVAIKVRQAYITDKVFCDSYMLWKTITINVAEGYDTDFIWNHLFDEKFTTECLAKDLEEIGVMIENDSFDIDFKDLPKGLLDCDDILSDIFQKVLFMIRLFRVNEKILRAPLASHEFDRSYRMLVEKTLQEEVTYNALYNPIIL